MCSLADRSVLWVFENTTSNSEQAWILIPGKLGLQYKCEQWF
jgi:hypothetical protein